jgi:hypothetical protein
MTKPGWSFWIISVLILLWNIMGIAAYYTQSSMDLLKLAATDPYQARLFAEMPQWAWLAYGVAVGTGTLGALGLLLRRGWAPRAFMVSLAALIIQFGYSFLGTDILAVRGWTTALFPLFIVIAAIGELVYALLCARKGLLR